MSRLLWHSYLGITVTQNRGILGQLGLGLGLGLGLISSYRTKYL